MSQNIYRITRIYYHTQAEKSAFLHEHISNNMKILLIPSWQDWWKTSKLFYLSVCTLEWLQWYIAIWYSSWSTITKDTVDPPLQINMPDEITFNTFLSLQKSKTKFMHKEQMITICIWKRQTTFINLTVKPFYRKIWKGFQSWTKWKKGFCYLITMHDDSLNFKD